MTKLGKQEALHLKLKHPTSNPCKIDRIDKSVLTLTFPPKQDECIHRASPQEQKEWDIHMKNYKLIHPEANK